MLGGMLSENKMKRTVFRGACFVVALIALLGVVSVPIANAASIYFTPASGKYTVGNILTANVFVNTQGEAINSADVAINFPNDLLEVVSVSKSGSIFSLWVEEPAFSNSAGTITFSGGLPAPGFNGSAGKIASIVFRVKSAGAASVLFSSAAVRANDGYGTDVLQARAQAQFTLEVVKSTPEAPPATTPSVPEEPPSATRTPRAPSIASATHPDQEAWYPNKNPSFNWSNGTDTTGVNVLADRKPTTNPGTNPDGLFSTYRYDDVDEGTWYFHVRLRNGRGWGDVSHYKFQIDTQKPDSLEVKQVVSEGELLKFTFTATDATSGIDRYEVALDGGTPQTWRPSGEGSLYELKRPGAGDHTLAVRAYDKAGNYVSKSVTFTIESIAVAPTITEYPEQVAVGAPITIAGSGAPSQQIIVWIAGRGDDGISYVTKTNAEGVFERVIEDAFAAGKYKVWAQAVADSGMKSPLSEKVSIRVGEPWKMPGGMIGWGVATLNLTMLVLIVSLYVWVIRLRQEIASLKRSVFGVGTVKNAVKTAAMLVRRRTPVKRPRVTRPPGIKNLE